MKELSNKGKLIVIGVIVIVVSVLIGFALSGDSDSPEAVPCNQLAKNDWQTAEDRAKAQAECNKPQADGSRRTHYYYYRSPSYFGSYRSSRSYSSYGSDSRRGRYRSSWGFGK